MAQQISNRPPWNEESWEGWGSRVTYLGSTRLGRMP